MSNGLNVNMDMTTVIFQDTYKLLFGVTLSPLYKLNILLLMQKCTFLFSNEVLDNDISHAVSVCIAILVEAVNCAEDKLVAGDCPILAAQHLDKR